MDTLKGRAVPPLKQFTFPISGVTIFYRPVSQFMLSHIEMDARVNFPPPEPPTFEYDTDDGKRRDLNYADPGYQHAMNVHRAELSGKTVDGAIEAGVEVEIDHAELDRITSIMERLGTPLHEISDKVAYVKYCCIIDIGLEIPLLVNRLKGVNEEAIQAKQESFPGDVQSQGSETI